MAILAHELRNPLAAIRSVADALNLMDLDDPGWSASAPGWIGSPR
jgi:signal transduction histidine kinase